MVNIYIAPSTESLWLLQVTDSLNRNGVKIISVQGHCVSIECAPCHCRREATTVDIYGTFNEKSFVLNIVQRGNGSLEEFIAELLQQKSILSADYCFALWAGGSVLRKVRSQFEKEPGWKKGDCEIFPLQGFPWKVGSKEERRFVQLFKACHPPLPIKVSDIIQVLERSHTLLSTVLFVLADPWFQEPRRRSYFSSGRD